MWTKFPRILTVFHEKRVRFVCNVAANMMSVIRALTQPGAVFVQNELNKAALEYLHRRQAYRGSEQKERYEHEIRVKELEIRKQELEIRKQEIAERVLAKTEANNVLKHVISLQYGAVPSLDARHWVNVGKAATHTTMRCAKKATAAQ